MTIAMKRSQGDGSATKIALSPQTLWVNGDTYRTLPSNASLCMTQRHERALMGNERMAEEVAMGLAKDDEKGFILGQSA